MLIISSTHITMDLSKHLKVKNRYSLKNLVRNMTESYPEASVHPVLADFTHSLLLPPLDGIVLANSLHFFKRKKLVLTRLISLLRPGGRLVVVEYNTGRSNYAVPYPLDEAQFLTLARKIGLCETRIVARAPSSFLGEMYTGMGLL